MNVSNDFQKRFVLLSTILFALNLSIFSSHLAHSKPTKKIVSINSIDDLVVSDVLALKNSEAFELTLTSNGTKFDLTLKPNKALLEKLAHSDHSTLVLYKGQVNGIDNSWVRLSDNNGVYSGAIYDGKELYFVDPVTAVHQSMSDTQFERYAIQSDNHQVIYKASDVNNSGLCGTESHNQSTSSFNYQEFVDELSVMASSLASREIEVALVADVDFNTVHGGNAADRMLIEMNIVDGIFSEQVNVQMSVVYSSVLSDNGALTMTDAVDLIYAFRDYTLQQVGNPGVTHLFTGKNLDSNTVGIAFVSALCTSYGVGVTQNLGSSTALVAAHEFGHNFGAPHDNQSGSACSSTPGGFLMNPSINGSDQFSSCSLAQMDSHINQANGYTGNQCVVDIIVPGPIAPLITSSAELNAVVGQEYQYDSDNKVDADGSTPLTYSFDFAPEGMTIDSDEGLINWTPLSSQVGTNPVQLKVSNTAGEDLQLFDITVEEPIPSDSINFNDNPTLQYGGSTQDTNMGTVTIEDNGATLNLTGNRWRAINFVYNVTANTVIEFDFKSSARGEIHGIGFNNNLSLDEQRHFKLFGTQNYGIQDFSYTGQGEYQHFVIPVGQFYTGAMTYLFFAMDHDVSDPDGESIYSNIRVYEQSQPPNIISTPNLTAVIGVPYNYDGDSTINVTGTSPYEYSLVLAPEGMTLDSNGIISWTPLSSQVGTNAVQLRVANSEGEDTQFFDITVNEPISININFNDRPTIQYGGSFQDTNNGTVTIEDNGATLNLTGNRWRAINYAYTVTANTVLEFDFKSSAMGEIHGIGFDNNLFLDEQRHFKLLGTQSYGIQDFSYTGQGEYQHFVIPVGQFYTGAMTYLFFAMDHDVSDPDGESIFSNIRVYEQSQPPNIISTPNLTAVIGAPYNYDGDSTINVTGTSPFEYSLVLAPEGMTIDSNGIISWTPLSSQVGTNAVQLRVANSEDEDTQLFDITVVAPISLDINFNDRPTIQYGGSFQDTNNGTVTIEDNGATLNLTGNRWRAINFAYNVTPNTVLEFDFKSSAMGEIHGIGFDNNLSLDAQSNFKLFGTQNYGIQDYGYTGQGEYQHFVIPVGQFYTGEMNYLFFAMDHDVTDPTANSYFRNVRIIE